MSVGIGGAGSKLASLLDKGNCVIVNVSEVELAKVKAAEKLTAVAPSARGHFKGSGKNPKVGQSAFESVREQLYELIKGQIVFSSTGGGTGNGLCTLLLERLAAQESVPPRETSMFVFILPYIGESYEFVENTIAFLMEPVSAAIDAGNTGNIVLASNRHKFERRLTEADYNQMLVSSLMDFLAIPQKGAEMELLDGHIDYEDFKAHQARPYFNHFCRFPYNPEEGFGEQLRRNFNPLLLPPERTIEAMFLLEVPRKDQTSSFYNILDHFTGEEVAPAYGVVLNPSLQQPHVTVSLLYSRKPLELVEDLKQTADKMTRKRVEKTLEQHVKLERKALDIRSEVKSIAAGKPEPEIEGVLEKLRRLRKMK